MNRDTVQLTATQLRISSDLWKRVKHEAVDNSVSANAMASILLEEALEGRRAPPHISGFRCQGCGQVAS